MSERHDRAGDTDKQLYSLQFIIFLEENPVSAEAQHTDVSRDMWKTMKNLRARSLSRPVVGIRDKECKWKQAKSHRYNQKSKEM